MRLTPRLPAFHDRDTSLGPEIIEHAGMTDGLEGTDDGARSPDSIVFEQAENRLHEIETQAETPKAPVARR